MCVCVRERTHTGENEMQLCEPGLVIIQRVSEVQGGRDGERRTPLHPLVLSFL